MLDKVISILIGVQISFLFEFDRISPILGCECSRHIFTLDDDDVYAVVEIVQSVLLMEKHLK